MCGLVGVVAPDGGLDHGDAHAAVAALSHRGPDGQGSWVSPCRRAVLAHTRLAVIDPAGGAQPLHTADGRLHLIANGEFYGYEQVRLRLARSGRRLLTRSDSEIALHLYDEHGPACAALLRGEFAFAIWDQGRGELVAARDRFGVKPLFWAEHAGRVLVASEVAALFASGVPAAWDPEALAEHLAVCHPPDRTLFAGIRQVPPGHRLVTDGRRVRVERYWDLDLPAECDLPPSDAARAPRLAAIREAVADAVAVRMRADVPIAQHLSGGLDSGSVAALAGRWARPRTFVVRFADPAFDEGPAAAATAAAIGAEHTEVLVGTAAAADRLADAVIRGQMVPENGHGAARLLHAEAIRAAGYRVVLAGEGGDEMFAGYPQSLRDLELSLVPGALERARTGYRRLAASGAGAPLLAVADRIGFVPTFMLDRYLAVTVPLRELLAPGFATAVQRSRPCAGLLTDGHVADQLAGRSPYHQSSYLFAKTWLANYLLAAERLDMSCGLEVRLPFLDHRVHDAVKDTPLSWYRDGSHSKPLLRAALRAELPPALHTGAKQGFLAPPVCADDGALSRIAGLLDGGALDGLPFFRPQAVRALLDRLATLPPARRAGHERVVQLVLGIALLTVTYDLAA